jgi:biotin-(acetyl-CoA carboxylase) ligase
MALAILKKLNGLSIFLELFGEGTGSSHPVNLLKYFPQKVFVISTESQTAGIGRRPGTTWKGSDSGGSCLDVIAMSVVSFMSYEMNIAERLPVFTMAMAMAAADAINSSLDIHMRVKSTLEENSPRVDIKWPNDLLFRGKKVKSYLLTSRHFPDRRNPCRC